MLLCYKEYSYNTASLGDGPLFYDGAGSKLSRTHCNTFTGRRSGISTSSQADPSSTPSIASPLGLTGDLEGVAGGVDRASPTRLLANRGDSGDPLCIASCRLGFRVAALKSRAIGRFSPMRMKVAREGRNVVNRAVDTTGDSGSVPPRISK
jgi:hypothetical protein